MSKVWFITGSSRGLGRSFVEAALAAGDKVAATARNPADVEDLVGQYGDAVLPLALDVSDKAAVFGSVQQAAAYFGRLDVIVNNAGYGLSGAVEELEEQQLRDQLETNFFGPLWVVQAAIPILREQGGGRIIQISSVAGLTGLPLGGAYCASKWALEGLSESLAQEVAPFGIKVTVVAPGGYDTPGASGAAHAPGDPLYDDLREAFAAYAKTLDYGNPAAAAQALLKLAATETPPPRLFFGTQGFPIVQQAYEDRLKTWSTWQPLAEEAHG